MKYLVVFLILLFAGPSFGQRVDVKRLRPLADGSGYVLVSGADGKYASSYLGLLLDDHVSAGVVDDSTDASGVVAVSHGNPDSTFAVVITVADTFTNVPVPVVIDKTSSTFSVRFYSAKDGAVFASDAIRFDWILRDINEIE